jgi:hypothetical protein
MDVLSLFTGLENSPVGVFVKDKGATFALIEIVHLLAWTLLGGTVLATDLRLLGVLLRDVPSKVVSDNAHKLFKLALITLLITGFFMLAGVATKCYHNFFFWVKMTTLLTGIIFVFAIKQPLLNNDHTMIRPVTLKLMAIASMSLWFVVAASGRWIGFS